MNRTPEQLKKRIVAMFDKSKYEEYADIDPGIKELMAEINTYRHIMTKHSCEGHLEQG